MGDCKNESQAVGKEATTINNTSRVATIQERETKVTKRAKAKPTTKSPPTTATPTISNKNISNNNISNNNISNNNTSSNRTSSDTGALQIIGHNKETQPHSVHHRMTTTATMLTAVDNISKETRTPPSGRGRAKARKKGIRVATAKATATTAICIA